MLDVDGGDDDDAGVEQLLDVLPPFGISRAGDVGVGELVDQDHLRSPDEDGVNVHLGERGTAVGDGPAGQGLQIADHLLGVLAAMSLHVADDDVRSPILASAALFEHLVRLADSGGGAKVDAQLPV
jgi:hypothetical protein